MANPKTASEKYARYENDSFNVWLQKTNVVSTEQGNLNNLDPSLLTEIQALTTRTGTVAGTLDGFELSGTTTFFTSDVSVGDIIRIETATPTVMERRVVSITNDTTLIVDIKFSETFSNESYENISFLSLVEAVNHTYESEIRRSLIRSIAMS